MSSISQNETYIRKKDGRQVVVAWWTITILVISLIIWGSSFNLRGLSVYMGLWLVIAILCYYFSNRWTFNNRLGLLPNVVEIPVYISFTMVLLISLFGAAPYFDNKYLLRQLSSVDELPAGLLLTGIGLFSMWIGYGLTVRLWPIHSKTETERKNRKGSLIELGEPSFQRTMIAYTAIVVFRLILFYMGWGERFGKTIDFGVWNQWLAYPLQLRWFFMALVALQVFKGRWSRSAFLFVIGYETLMAVISGWSSTLLKIAIILVGCFLYAQRRLPVRAVIVSSLFLVAMLVILTPVARFYRTVDNSSIINSLTALSEGFGNRSTNESIIFTSNLLIKRQTDTAQTPSLFLKFTPVYIPYRPIEDLLTVPLSFIPRIIWPNKPEYGRLGGIITQEYFGIFRFDAGASASTLAGSAYIYGGWGVVVVSMFILGVVSALFYTLIALPALKKENMALLALYIGVVIFNFHIGEGDILGLWQGFVQTTIVFWVVYVFLCIRKREKVKFYTHGYKSS